MGPRRRTVPGKRGIFQRTEGHEQLVKHVAAAGLEGVGAGRQKEHPRGATFAFECDPDLVVRASTCMKPSPSMAVRCCSCMSHTQVTEVSLSEFGPRQFSFDFIPLNPEGRSSLGESELVILAPRYFYTFYLLNTSRVETLSYALFRLVQ